MAKRVYLGAPDEALVRDAVVAIAAHACGARQPAASAAPQPTEPRRVQGDPEFEHVVEGRQKWWLVNGKRRDYSGCGDLLHASFFRLLGARAYDDPKMRAALRWLNRREAYGWRGGMNVSLLRFTCKAFRPFKRGEFNPKRGDGLLIGEGGAEHVMVVEHSEPGRFSSYDYGQFYAEAGKHGGGRCSRIVGKGRDGRAWCGSKTLSRPCIGVVDVWRLYELACAAGNLEAALVPEWFAGGTPSDNPYA